MVRSLTLLVALSVSASAFAADTAPAAPAATPEERPSPDWYTESTVFGASSGIPGHRPFAHGGAGNTPIVGQDAAGNFIDVRDGRTLSADEAAAALAASSTGGDAGGVTVLHAETSGSKGITRGKLKNGSIELAKGKLGKVSIDAGNAWGYAAAGVAAAGDGARTGGVTGGSLTLVGLSASTKTFGFGKKDAKVKGAAEGLGYAMLGADGSASGLVRIGADALAVGARVGAFVGASAGLSGVGEVSVAGVALRVLAGAAAGYGLGSEAAAFFKVDWANWAVRVGGQALAALGPAAGLSLDVEVSLAGLMKKWGVNDAIRRGVLRAAGAVKSAGLTVARKLGLFSGAPAAEGSAVDREAQTASVVQTPAPTAAAAGAGMARE